MSPESVMRCPHFHFLCCLGFTLFYFSVCHISAEVPTRPKIVFNSTRDGNTEIYMMDTDGKQQVRLTRHPDADFQPVWSPTGEQILFVSNRDGVRDLYLMDADGENVRRVFKKIAMRQQPAWSGDGKRIAYLRDTGDARAIYIATLDGKEEHLTSPGKSGWFPAWSPDGSEIVFPKTDFLGLPTPLEIINIHTREQETLHPQPELKMACPTWSPDGTTIAFAHYGVLNKNGPVTGALYIVKRDGSGLHAIIPNKEPHPDMPIWSARGDEIAYNEKIGKNRQIFKIDMVSRQSTRLTNRGTNVYPDWFDPAFALPVAPKPQLITTIWAKVKTIK